MRKIQVFLRDDQKAALKSMAARTGRKQSDLIRAGVDLLIHEAAGEDAGWREATRAAAGIWKDRDDLDTFDREFRASVERRFRSLHED